MIICRIARGNAKSIGLSPWKTPLEVAFIGAGQAFPVEEFVAILADKINLPNNNEALNLKFVAKTFACA